MTTITQNLGKIIANPRGKYSALTQYYEFDEVIYNSELYRARKGSAIAIGTLPTNVTYWTKTNAIYTQELVAIEKFDFTLVNNSKFALDSIDYDKVTLDINVVLSSASLIYIDTKFGAISSFPSNASYNTYYDADDNYSELYLDVNLRDYNNVSRKTRAIALGTGFTAGLPAAVSTVFEADIVDQTNAINVVALNGVTMNGTIILKKYKYLFA